MLRIDHESARRFILGQQGLWPGRRWQGLDGTAQAMRAIEFLQLDPLQVIARSHDIQLHSRVLDYQPGLWERAAYQARGFFDWGGWLAVRPMDELPYWRVVMRRERDGTSGDKRIHLMGQEHDEAIHEMRLLLQEQESVMNRDFSAASRTRTTHYRGRKDSALALYYLWRTGEVMTHHRENFERVYALAEKVAPAALLTERDEAETNRFLIRKEIAFAGIGRLRRTAEAFHGRGEPDRAAPTLLDAMLADGELVEVTVEGWKGTHYVVGRDAPLLEELAAGRIPAAWAPLDTTTTEEATFLAPLEPVSARGRAKSLFDFNYVWEVYKPAVKRQFGYYVLPILWGERLVGRFDSKLDRPSQTLVLHGLWLEEATLSRDDAFVSALVAGFRRFMTFLGAKHLSVEGVEDKPLRRALAGIGKAR